MTVLVVGADGVIGRALYAHLKQANIDVIGSTRRPPSASGDLIHLNLATVERATLSPASAAVICAGATSLAACRSAPDATRAINVEGSLALAGRLAAEGTFVVALSTNLVFDGQRPLRAATDPPQPQSEYGRPRRDLEDGIIALGAHSAVVRLTKIVSPQTTLLRNWRDSLQRGEVVMPFLGIVMSPIPLDRVIAALARLLNLRSPGIFQLSATDEVSYVDTANIMADAVVASRTLVQPRPPSDDIISAERPPFTSLDTARACAELNWRPITSASALMESMRA